MPFTLNELNDRLRDMGYPKILVLPDLVFQEMWDKLNPQNRRFDEEGYILFNTGYPSFLEVKLSPPDDKRQRWLEYREELIAGRPDRAKWTDVEP